MMRRTTILLGSVLLYTASVAQSVEESRLKITYGASFENPKGGDGYIMGESDKGLLYYSYGGEEYNFRKVSPSLSLTAGSSAAYSTLPGKVVSFEYLGGKELLFTNEWNRKENNMKLYMGEVDLKTGKYAPKNKELLSVTRLEDKVVSGSYDFIYAFRNSVDKSKFLIGYRFKVKSTDDAVNKDEFGFNVYDTLMNPIWSKVITMPYTEEMMDNEQLIVDKKGNVYLLAKVYTKSLRDREKDNTPNGRLEILRFEAGTGALTKIPVKYQGYFINNLNINETEAGDIAITGIYTSNSKPGSVDGMYYVRIKPDGSIEAQNNGYYNIPENVLLADKGNAEVKKYEGKNLELNNFDYGKVIIEKDGSAFFCGEVHYYTSSGNISESHYEDIIAMKIGKAGNMDWCVKIPKKQVSMNSHVTLSYSAFSANKNYYFLYTDNLKNLTADASDKVEKHIDGGGGWLAYSRVDEKGNVSKSKLFDYKEKNFEVSPTRADQLSDSEIVVYGTGKQNKIVLLKVQ